MILDFGLPILDSDLNQESKNARSNPQGIAWGGWVLILYSIQIPKSKIQN